MNCPACKSPDSGVTETRLARGRNQPEAESYGVRRRRQCNACKHRWTTVEINAELLASVVNVLEGVRGLVSMVAKIPDKTLLDMSGLFEDTQHLRSHLGRHERASEPNTEQDQLRDLLDRDFCESCGGRCLYPTIGIDPVTRRHYFGG